MILNKYIFKEIVRSQLVTLFVLLSVFLCQSIIKYISRASVGRVPVDIVSSMVAYSVPSIAYLMLPLTLFVAILISLGRISSDSEMVVMRSVGYSTVTIMKIALFIAAITSVVIAFNSFYLMPTAAKAQKDLMANAENNPTYLPIESGNFINFGSIYNIYIDEVEKEGKSNKDISNVYVFSNVFTPAMASLTIAKQGHISLDEEGTQWLNLDDGTRYEGPLSDGSFRNFSFDTFKMPTTIDKEKGDANDTVAVMSTSELLTKHDNAAMLELQWRFAPILACFILTMVAVPLSLVNPRQGKFARLMPALLIYVSYYLILLSLRNMINSDKLSIFPGLYIVPVLYLIFVVFPLNTTRSFFSFFKKNKTNTQKA